MLRLMILRHARAATPEGVRDLDRPLDPAGRAEASRVGRYLGANGLLPNQVLVSPARRTQETWDLVRHSLPGAPDPVDAPIYGMSALQLMQLLRKLDRKDEAVLLIGHNPGCEELAQLLAGTGDPSVLKDLRQHYPPASLAVLDFNRANWSEIDHGGGRLERFVTPESIMAA
jgi:phosphohistidine phosphatase